MPLLEAAFLISASLALAVFKVALSWSNDSGLMRSVDAPRFNSNTLHSGQNITQQSSLPDRCTLLCGFVVFMIFTLPSKDLVWIIALPEPNY